MIDVAAEAGNAKIHVLLGEDVTEVMAPVLIYECLFGDGLVAVVVKGFVECMPPGVDTVDEDAVKVKKKCFRGVYSHDAVQGS